MLQYSDNHWLDREWNLSIEGRAVAAYIFGLFSLLAKDRKCQFWCIPENYNYCKKNNYNYLLNWIESRIEIDILFNYIKIIGKTVRVQNKMWWDPLIITPFGRINDDIPEMWQTLNIYQSIMGGKKKTFFYFYLCNSTVVKKTLVISSFLKVNSNLGGHKESSVCLGHWWTDGIHFQSGFNLACFFSFLLRFYSSSVSVQHVPAGVIREQLAKVLITVETLCWERAMCSLNTDESSSGQRALHSQGCYKHNHTMLWVGPCHSYPLQPCSIHWDDDNYTIPASALARWWVSCNIEMYEIPAVTPSCVTLVIF